MTHRNFTTPLIAALSFVPLVAAAVEPLGPGTSATLTVSWRQPATVQIDIPARGHYQLVVDQNGLDLHVAVAATGGVPRVYDSPTLRDGTEQVLIEASGPARYDVSLSTPEYSGAVALPRIAVADLAGRPQDVATLRDLTSAAEANALQTTDGWSRARALYSGVSQTASNAALRAHAFYAVAQIAYWQLGNWSEAAQAAEGARTLFIELDQPGLAANAQFLRASAMLEATTGRSSDVTLADVIRILQETRDAQLSLGRRYDAARTLNQIGIAAFYAGSMQSAVDSWQGAIDGFRVAQEWGAELQSMGNLGAIAFQQGRLTDAIASFSRVVELLPDDSQIELRADTLDNLATAQLALGDFEAALATYTQAHDLHRQLGHEPGRSLQGIATAYDGIGETERASYYLTVALESLRHTNDARGQAAVLRYLGDIHRRQGRTDEAARAHREAMTIAQTPLDRARASIALAGDLTDGDSAQALTLIDDALALARTLQAPATIADALRARGIARRRQGETRLAIADLQQALELADAYGLDMSKASSLHELARVYRHVDSERAIEHAQASLDEIERLRGHVSNPELRATYLAARRSYYDLLIDLLMSPTKDGGPPRPDRVARALGVSENARSRVLVDLIHEAGNNRPATDLDERRSDLYRSLVEAQYRRDRLIESGVESAERVASLVAEMRSIERRLDVIEAEIRDRSGGDIGYIQPLDATAIRRQLGDDTTLLQFHLGTDSSYVWVVNRHAISSARLPQREAISDLARRLNERLHQPARSSARRRERSELIAQLSALVLSPIHAELTTSRLLVAADDTLHYVPFALLEGDASSASSAPLIRSHVVVSVPSMSALAALRHRNVDPAMDAAGVAVFGNPAFARADSLPAPARDANRLALPPLPHTGREVAAIAGLLGEDGVEVYTGADASLASLRALDLAAYRVLHFATHGLVDTRHPALSSIALSTVDRDGHAIDGMLRQHDIYGMSLNADLVVLSACDTALGREVEGEGLISLAHGFMSAGARSVIASLWQVPDQATAALMTHLYASMSIGMLPAEALRQAQLAVADVPRWRDPYYWGAFVVQGGDQPVSGAE